MIFIHKAKNKILHERVRNINHILYLSELKRHESYTKLRELIKERDLTGYSLLINKIKDFRHYKVKLQQKA